MMDQTRFTALAEAFGGDIERWPSDLRAEATAFRDDHPDLASAILAQEAALDAQLVSAAIAPPSADLTEQIIASGVSRLARPPIWTTAIAAAVMLIAGAGAGWMGGAAQDQAGDDWLDAEVFTVLDDGAPLWEELS